MNAAGWTIMLLSVGGVLALAIFCFWRVFKTPQFEEHAHAPLDIDTHDRET